MTVLNTQRLTLRPALAVDATAYSVGISDYEVARFLTPVPHPYSVAMARDWLANAPVSTPQRPFFVIDLADVGLIGSITLLGELGFWIARPYWNRGYLTEAATALLDWHFANTDVQSVVSSAHFDNAASLKVQTNLGFQETGLQMRFAQTLQRDVEHVTTALARADFAARRRPA